MAVDRLWWADCLQDLTGLRDTLEPNSASALIELPIGGLGADPANIGFRGTAAVEKLELGTGPTCRSHVKSMPEGCDSDEWLAARSTAGWSGQGLVSNRDFGLDRSARTMAD